jgi:site-specific recombinase XerD
MEHQLFEAYLYSTHLRTTTIKQHLQNIEYFLQWVKANELEEVENISYHNLLQYVQYERLKHMDVSTINLRISSVSKYFEYLKATCSVSVNPARILRIKGKAKKVVENPISYNELERLYHDYKALQRDLPNNVKEKSQIAHKRNIVIVGLLIWQGLHGGEIAKLETTHINLQEGTIYIPSTTRSNSRTLPLHMQQVLTMHSYIHGGIRDGLYPKAELLIPGNVHNIIHAVVAQIKGIHPGIRNVQHIRASVILHWLRQHNKRQVQYMAGHKYIDSTEKYERQELTSLTDALTRYHPFG